MSLRLHSSEPLPWQETGLTPARCLRAFGMRRSGNHAIADWLLRNAGGTGSVFFNNCVPGRSPVKSFRTIAVNRSRRPLRAAQADLAGTCTDAGAAPTFLVTYEDIPPMGKRARPISGELEATFDFDIIIYRGFLNWCASFLRKLQKNAGYSRTHRASIVLKSVDGYSRMLSLVGDAENLSLVPVCYDDWLASDAYRAGRLERLGLSVTDNSPGRVQSYGGGSSFQDRAEAADELQTDRRFEQMADDPDFLGILNIAAGDERLRRQLEQHFPEDDLRLKAVVERAQARHG